MKHKKLFAFVAVLATLALGTAASFSAPAPAPQPGAAFTIRFTATYFNDAGEAARSHKEILRVASDGSFRRIATDGVKIFSDQGFNQGRGYMLINHEKREMTRHPTQTLVRPPSPLTAEMFRNDPNFSGTDTIFGVTAYKVTLRDDRGALLHEAWRVPEFGGFALRTREYKGGRMWLSLEPASVEFGEPNPASIRFPDYPVRENTHAAR